jgi:hypothetical protein
MMSIRCASAVVTVLVAASGIAAGRQMPTETGIYAEANGDAVALKQTLRGIAVVGGMSNGQGTRALVFPIGALDGVPIAQGVTAFLVNFPTIQDNAAAAAEMRLMIGERVREPDFAMMQANPGKFRTGQYRITSPQLTHEWLASTYAKLTNTRKWRDKHPPAIVGLILNGEMYPVRIDEAWLQAR